MPGAVDKHRTMNLTGNVWRRCHLNAVLAATLLTSACAGIGPHRLPADRFDYGAAIAASTNEQMLLNLVRLRYNEMPVFLDVDTVIAQYQFDAHAQFGAELGISGTAAPPGDSILIPEAGAGWLERPTITYAPRTGPKLIRSLLTPLPPATVFQLVQSDWPVEDIVWGVVKSINGVGPRSPIGGWNPDYSRMLEALSQIQRARALSVGFEGEAPKAFTLRFRRTGLDDKTAAAIATLQRIWGLNPKLSEYRLVPGVVPRNANEIAILTSSMLDLMQATARFMEVPPGQVKEGKSAQTLKLPPEAPYGGRAPISLQLNRERPRDAFVAVQKDGWWLIRLRAKEPR